MPRYESVAGSVHLAAASPEALAEALAGYCEAHHAATVPGGSYEVRSVDDDGTAVRVGSIGLGRDRHGVAGIPRFRPDPSPAAA